MAKHLGQSKHLLAVELKHDFKDRMEHPHQQLLSTFFEAIGLRTSVKEIKLTYRTSAQLVSGLVSLMLALEENETLEYLDLESNNDFSARGYLSLASSLPNIKGLRQIDFSYATSDPSVMSAMLEGFQKNTNLVNVVIEGGVHGKDWSEQLTFFLSRNQFSRLLRDSDTDDRSSLGLWSRALGSVATQPAMLFHVLTSKAGLIRATPGEDSKKRKRDDSE